MKIFSTLSELFKNKAPINSTQEPHSSSDHVASHNDASHNDASVKKILELVLQQAGCEFNATEEVILLSSGITLHTELVEIVHLGPDKVRTCTKITAVHDTYFPNGLPEFQHAVSGNTERSLSEGFSAWAKIDLIALEDSVKPKPQHCTLMKIQFPSTTETGERVRHIILGPVGHIAVLPSPKEEDHPFCPCCLLTRNFKAFQPLLASKDTLGIRFFVCRDKDGNSSADCRVNGEAFPDGVSQLIEYTNTWPARGFEIRKQYIVVRTGEA